MLAACAPVDDNAFVGADLYVNPESSAALAASRETDPERLAAFNQLASVPSAIWLLPEVHPTNEIGAYVGGITTAAAVGGELPVFVVYGIPSRDCGNFSAGGAVDAEYGDWISAIASGLAQRRTIIVLEPDSLALSPSCGTEDQTARFLNDAIDRFADTGAVIYLDGGNSNWLPEEQMAKLLTAAGVSRVRGFATNTSNYNSTVDEQDYGNRLSAMLNSAHFVIDTSRNGNGSTGEWCNPSGRAIGDLPAAIAGSKPHDANLWIKTPGESDGMCNGGPPAGQWWDQAALELVQG